MKTVFAAISFFSLVASPALAQLPYGTVEYRGGVFADAPYAMPPSVHGSNLNPRDPAYAGGSSYGGPDFGIGSER